MTVLVLGEERDPAIDAVIEELGRREVPVFRADTSWFPQQMTLSGDLDTDLGRWTGSLRTEHREQDLTGLRSVWFRSPTSFDLPATLSEPERRHALWEAKLGFGGVLADLDALWVNHPAADARAAYKPRQLTAAARAGLRVPPSLVTNRAEQVRRFAAEYGPIVVKSLGFGAIIENDGARALYTHVLTDDDLADLSGIGSTAHLLQAFVGDKDVEARVTVVGDRIFGTAVTAGSAAAVVDWRSDYAALSFDEIAVPDAVTDGIRAVMAGFGLCFGAFDFVIDTDGRWWFLEVNAGGQYGFVESATGQPITSAIAELLQKGQP